MPKTKVQKIVFGLLMSYTMAIGMEIYNIAYKQGVHLEAGGFSSMMNGVFPAALAEAGYMGILVFLFSNLWGNRFGAAFAEKYTNSEKDNPYFCQIMRQAGTVAIMCPTMSLVASILFSVIMAHESVIQLPAIWLGTIIKNFPMAFFWNMFAAAPFTRWIFSKIFK